MATKSIANFSGRIICHSVGTSPALTGSLKDSVGFDNKHDNYYCLGIPITTPNDGTTSSVTIAFDLTSGQWGATTPAGNSTWKIWVSKSKYVTTSNSNINFSKVKGNVTTTFTTSTASGNYKTQQIKDIVIDTTKIAWEPDTTYYVYVYNLIASTGYHCLFDMTSFSATATYTKYTYKVSYNANGGSGAPSDQTKEHGTTLTLSSTKPTRAGYEFLGWGKDGATDTTADYQPGGSYTNNAAITLYAIWKLNACVRIRVGSEWKTAVPYVYTNGQWKQTIPYIRVNNAWKLVGG